MKNLWKLIQLFELYRSGHVPLKVLFGKRVSVASSVILSQIRNIVPSLEVIIDVGANVGQFALSSNRYFPAAKIISFEPDPLTFNILKGNVTAHTNIEVHNCALGSQTGVISFYRNKDNQTSSILPPVDGETGSETTVIEVDIKRLETFFDTDVYQKQVLLKLDVQGYEKIVLEGCGALLKNISYVLIEVSFKEFYKGEAIFDDLNELLRSSGFQLVRPLNFLNNGIEIMQADLLYRKIMA